MVTLFNISVDAQSFRRYSRDLITSKLTVLARHLCCSFNSVMSAPWQFFVVFDDTSARLFGADADIAKDREMATSSNDIYRESYLRCQYLIERRKCDSARRGPYLEAGTCRDILFSNGVN